MASPFQFFRKHQASMMVVLVILAMLVFTLDALFTQAGANFWLLGLLLGGAIFGVAGISSGQWLQWGIGGGLLGVLLGLILPSFTGPPPLAAASFGVIERTDLDDMLQRRAVANGFLMRATQEAFGEETFRMFMQFGQLQQFGFGQSESEDVLFGRLMEEEARELGITVSDQMVSDFINQATGDQLTADGFSDARRVLQYQGQSVSPETLFEILKGQIAARMAYRALVPMGSVSPLPPEAQWDYYKRMNVRQQINVAELDVDAFTDQVPEPSEPEIEELFASARERFPNQEEPGSPGFRLPARTRIAWMEVDFESMESTVPAVTDDEVQVFYDENRETPRFRKVKLPDPPVKDSDEAESPEGTQSTEAADEPISEEETAEESTGVNESPEEATDETPAKDESSAEESAEEPAVEESTSENSGTAEPPTEESGGDEPVTEEATSEEPAAEESSADESSVPVNGSQFSVQDDVAEEESSAAEPADEADNDAGAKEDDPLPLVIPQQTTNGDGQTAESAVEYEYVELTDELREEIREELHTLRVREAIDEKLLKAQQVMQSISRERNERRSEIVRANPDQYAETADTIDAGALALRAELSQATPEYLDRMKKHAEENDLTYAITPQLVTFTDFMDEDNYPLGRATEPNPAQFQMGNSGTNVAYEIFSAIGDSVVSNDSTLFVPRRARYLDLSDKGTESHYVYWAVEVSESHLPTLDEEGVQDLVVRAFKQLKARELVKTRAEELAQQVRDGLAKEGEERQSMAATLESVTITGNEGSATLNVRESQSFSWIRASQAPGMSFQRQSRPELSPVRFADGVSMLDTVGSEFMETVFEEMQDEEVKVVPNADRSAYLIVHVTNRFPTPEIGMDGLMERFAGDGRTNFSQAPVMQLIRGDLVSPAVTEWSRSVWQKYDIDPTMVLPQLQM